MALDGAKHGDHGAAAAEIENPLPGVADELGGAVHEYLQDRFDPPTPGRMADRSEFAGRPELADQAQAVVANMPRWRMRSLRSNLPEGSRSRSRAVLISECNCSCVPCRG